MASVKFNQAVKFIEWFYEIFSSYPSSFSELLEPDEYYEFVEFMSKYAKKNREAWAMELEELKEERQYV